MATDDNTNATVQAGILCPRCDYDLRGSPRDGRCPECGLRFNDRSYLWESPSMLAPVRGPLMIIALIICGFQVYRLTVAADPREVTMQVVLLIGLLLAFGVGLLPMWFGCRNVLAVCADGIVVRKPWRGMRFIPFDQVADIRSPEHPTIPNVVIILIPSTPNQQPTTVQIRCHQYTRPQVDTIVTLCVESWQHWRREQQPA